MRANLELEQQVLDNDETKLNKLNEQNNHINWKDPNPFTNYQIYHSVVTNESTDSTNNTNGSSDTGNGTGRDRKSVG